MGENKVKFRVKNGSNVHGCAVALSKLLMESKEVEVCCIGAGAVNQSVKIIVKARSICCMSGLDWSMVPGMRNEQLTVVKDGKQVLKEMSVVTFCFRKI